jgi:hypothetical protein
MTPRQSSESELLCTRLKKLEARIHAIVTGWVLSLVVVVFLGVAVRQTLAQPDVLRARRIEVIDAAGRVRGGLGIQQDGTSELFLADSTQRRRIRLQVFVDGSLELGFYDAKGGGRAALTAFAEGTARLMLQDGTRRRRIFLTVLADGSQLTPWDIARQGNAGLMVLPNGRPALSLVDATGRVLFRAP